MQLDEVSELRGRDIRAKRSSPCNIVNMDIVKSAFPNMVALSQQGPRSWLSEASGDAATRERSILLLLTSTLPPTSLQPQRSRKPKSTSTHLKIQWEVLLFVNNVKTREGDLVGVHCPVCRHHLHRALHAKTGIGGASCYYVLV